MSFGFDVIDQFSDEFCDDSNRCGEPDMKRGGFNS